MKNNNNSTSDTSQRKLQDDPCTTTIQGPFAGYADSLDPLYALIGGCNQRYNEYLGCTKDTIGNTTQLTKETIGGIVSDCSKAAVNAVKIEQDTFDIYSFGIEDINRLGELKADCYLNNIKAENPIISDPGCGAQYKLPDDLSPKPLDPFAAGCVGFVSGLAAMTCLVIVGVGMVSRNQRASQDQGDSHTGRIEMQRTDTELGVEVERG